MIPSYFEFLNPGKILSGNKALENLPYELDQLGAKKPIMITDKGVVKAGLIRIVKRAFAGSKMKIGAIYDDTPQDSSVKVVNEIAEIYRKNKCDSLIAVGGGSVIDTAKAVNIVITEDSDDLLKFMGVGMLKKDMKPFIVIPTTAGTGSEVTTAAIIANPDKNIKMAFMSAKLLPKVAILDPRMTQTMPSKITASTGMDALTHAAEAFYCIQKNPISDAYAFSAINLIRQYLIKAVEEGKNSDARIAMANAALLAGVAFSNSLVGMVHGLAHACGGVCHVPHGLANSILLPFGMEYNIEKVPDYIGELLLPLAGPEIYASVPKRFRAVRSVTTVRELTSRLNKICRLPLTLKDAGVPKDQLEKIAETAINDGAMTLNPEDVDYNDALDILKAAY